MGVVGGIVWQFNNIQPVVLSAFGTPPTATPGAAQYGQRGNNAFLQGDLEGAIDNYCLGSGGRPTALGQDPRCILPPENSDAARNVNLDVAYELVKVLIYRYYDDDRRLGTYAKDARQWGGLLSNVYPRNSRARAIYSFALTNIGEAEKAVPEGLSAINLNPGDGEAYAFLSLANYFSGRYTNALTYAEKAVSLAPDSVDARVAYAKALFLTGRNRQAEEEYKNARAIYPRLAFPYFESAAFYLFRAGKQDGLQLTAIEMYDQVLSLDSKNVKAYTRRCTAYFNIGQNDNALDDCRSATGLDPLFTEAWKWQGQVFYNKRDYEDAIDSFKKCQALDEDAVKRGVITRGDMYPECWYLQGLSYYLLNQCEKAIPLFSGVLDFTNSETVKNLTARGIEGCQRRYPDIQVPATSTPLPTRPPPIR
jgi:tetratricopeptide (TPR) repeat protein